MVQTRNAPSNALGAGKGKQNQRQQAPIKNPTVSPIIVLSMGTVFF